jgi:hypothetical protein
MTIDPQESVSTVTQPRYWALQIEQINDSVFAGVVLR